jgi:lipopolysaccharide assembly protein A
MTGTISGARPRFDAYLPMVIFNSDVNEINTQPASPARLVKTIFSDGRQSAFSKRAVRYFAAANQDFPDCEDKPGGLFFKRRSSWPNITIETHLRKNRLPVQRLALSEGAEREYSAGGSIKNMSFRLMLILILAGLVTMFIIQNVEAVEVSFLFWSIAMSRALLIVFALAIGFVVGWIGHGYLALQRSKERSVGSV